jgi:hypothetical protein
MKALELIEGMVNDAEELEEEGILPSIDLRNGL